MDNDELLQEYAKKYNIPQENFNSTEYFKDLVIYNDNSEGLVLTIFYEKEKGKEMGDISVECARRNIDIDDLSVHHFKNDELLSMSPQDLYVFFKKKSYEETIKKNRKHKQEILCTNNIIGEIVSKKCRDEGIYYTINGIFMYFCLEIVGDLYNVSYQFYEKTECEKFDINNFNPNNYGNNYGNYSKITDICEKSIPLIKKLIMNRYEYIVNNELEKYIVEA